MQSDRSAHKLGHTIVGIVGIFFLIASSVFSSLSQQRSVDAFNNLADSIHRLATPANIKENSDVDQILAAAAAKLIKQDQEIHTLNDKLRDIIHPQNGLYVKDTLVGLTEGFLRISDNEMLFPKIMSGKTGIDFGQVLKFSDFWLRCDPPNISTSFGGLAVNSGTSYGQVHCKLVNPP